MVEGREAVASLEAEELEELLQAWIRYQANRGEADYWSHSELRDICRKLPDTAWQVISQLVARFDDPRRLALVATDPLEHLLTHHGPRVVARIEAEASREPALRAALANVRRGAMDDEVWSSIQKVLQQSRSPSWL